MVLKQNYIVKQIFGIYQFTVCVEIVEGCETIKTLKSGITDEGCSSFCNALQNTNFSMSLLRSLQRDSIFT